MLSAGARAPQFVLKDLDGTEHSLDGLREQGPAVLVFFKVSCPTCQLALPFVERIAAKAPRLIAISQDPAPATRDFRSYFHLSMPMLLDPAGDGYAVSNAFGITHVPTFFLISADGMVEHSFTGFVKTDLEELGRQYGVETFRPDEKVPFLKPG